jgi:hypothetical protein
MVHSNPIVAFPIAVLLAVASMPIARRVAARERDPRLYRLLVVAAIAHLIFSGIQLFVVNHVYHGITDYNRYINQGAILARRFDRFNFTTGGIQPPVNILGEGAVSIAAGVVMAIIGVNKLALLFVFSWFAFLATIGYFRAFSVTFPEANHYRYAVLVFFLPSLLFWTAGISKETIMFMSLGMMAWGAANILSHKRAGASLLVVGAIIGIYIRPQELLLFMGAFVAAGFFRRRSTSRSFRGVRRLAFMGLQVVLLLAALSLSQQLAKHAPVFNLKTLAQNNAGQASSLHYHPGPTGYPRDVYTVVFDPQLFNFHGSTQFIAAIENTAIVILILSGLRRLKALPRAAFTRPYVLLCTLYCVAFPYAFAALNNLGLIDRERVLFLPFLLVLLAIPVSPRDHPKQFPWEYSVGRRKRRQRQQRWGMPTPVHR